MNAFIRTLFLSHLFLLMRFDNLSKIDIFFLPFLHTETAFSYRFKPHSIIIVSVSHYRKRCLPNLCPKQVKDIYLGSISYNHFQTSQSLGNRRAVICYHESLDLYHMHERSYHLKHNIG